MFKKSFFISAFIFLILGVFFLPNLISAPEPGYIKMVIASPLGTTLFDDSDSIRVGEYQNRQPSITTIPARLSDMGSEYAYESIDGAPYCREGGFYTMNVHSYVGDGREYDSGEVNIFYCSTMKDLLSLIKIPSAWSNDEIIFYCNDGLNTNYWSNNFEVITSRIDAYKVCVLKNLDLEVDNSIVYGLEIGNLELDDMSEMSSLTSKLEHVSGNEFKDNDLDKNYWFDFNNESSFFVLKDSDIELDLDLINIFNFSNLENFENFDLTRTIMFKNLGGGRKVMGYEIAGTLTNQENTSARLTTVQPVYVINSLTSGLDQEDCVDLLSTYGAKSSESQIDVNDKILCRNSGNIWINSENFAFGEGYNLFKNIILNLE